MSLGRAANGRITRHRPTSPRRRDKPDLASEPAAAHAASIPACQPDRDNDRRVHRSFAHAERCIDAAEQSSSVADADELLEALHAHVPDSAQHELPRAGRPSQLPGAPAPPRGHAPERPMTPAHLASAGASRIGDLV